MNPRQEPYEVIPHVRIRAGGRSQGRSLPRLIHLSPRLLSGLGIAPALKSISWPQGLSKRFFSPLDFEVESDSRPKPPITFRKLSTAIPFPDVGFRLEERTFP